jgi:hypothetical protein
LKEETIIWRGKPKAVQDKEPIDVVVTMGCEVECPVIPAAREDRLGYRRPVRQGYRDLSSDNGAHKGEGDTELLEEID